MGFFFTAAETRAAAEAKAAGKGGKSSGAVASGTPKVVLPIRVLGSKSRGCSTCALDGKRAQMDSPKLPPSGSADPLLYIMGEAPDKEEDETGEAGEGYLNEFLAGHIPKKLEPHVRWGHAVRCRTTAPNRDQLISCSNHQVRDIEATKPAVILGLGAAPLAWVADLYGIQDWRGRLIPVRIGSHVCWYAPVWHPAFVRRMGKDKKMGQAYLDTYKRDIDRVCDQLLKGTLPEPYVPEGEELSAGMHWELSWKVEEVKHFLDHMRQFKKQCVDIETNGLRPYAADSKILSIAFGTWDLSYAIPLSHRESKWTPEQLKQVWGLVRDYLQDRSITFYAHLLKFELEWLGMPWALGRDILFTCNWGDTMAQAEALRTQGLSSKSLDSCCIANMGIGEKALDGLDRARLDAVPLPKVLRYNARDVKFSDYVRQVQEREIEVQGLQRAYGMLVSRVPALTCAQQDGLVPNFAFAEASHIDLAKQMEAAGQAIQKLPDVRQFVNATGEPFNPGSTKQLTTFLRDYLKVKEGWRKVGGEDKYSTDEDVLKLVKHPIAPLILEQRGLQKLDSTYVIGLCRKGSFPDPACGKLVWADGLVHTNFNYLVTRTGRLSSDDPNVQNFPKREHKEIRNCIGAPNGYWMVAADYGQIEARVIAMASRCPVLCAALWEHYDIHMDWAQRIAKAFGYVFDRYLKEVGGKDEKKAMKVLRSDIKNQWTFPQFFGSPLAPIANVLGVPERDLAPYSKKFWEMFAEVKRWQERVLVLYKKKGYTETLTGRRRYEPLSANEIINSPIQGTASDIVVRGMETLSYKAWEEGRPQISPRINVHDDLSFYLPPATLEQDLGDIVQIMCTPQFDFINVPITIEVGLGKTWGTIEDTFTAESTDYGYPTKEIA